MVPYRLAVRSDDKHGARIHRACSQEQAERFLTKRAYVFRPHECRVGLHNNLLCPKEVCSRRNHLPSGDRAARAATAFTRS